jgi:hypothetical protein
MITPVPTVNPTGAPILPGQNLGQPSTLPTPAPAVTAYPPVGSATAVPSTKSPASSPVPTAVVSSGAASSQVNNKIVPTMNQGQQDIQTGITNAQAQAQKIQDNITAMKAASAAKPPVTPPTPEETAMNTPDPGNQWLYDSSGNKVQNTLGSPIPPGYSTKNPTVAPTTPQTDSTTDSMGNTYVQYSDGTYGKFDANGNYAGTTNQNLFDTTKAGTGILTSLNQALNGTYPLSVDQQAQINGLKAQFQTLIDQQTTANANFTGGVTVAENLYGMGNSVSGLGEIKGSIDAGISKIATLNSQMGSAVAQMTQSFQDNNIKNLQSAYTLYNDAAKSRQAEVDKLQATATQAQQDFQKAQQTQITNTLESDKFTYQQKQDAIDNAIKQGTLDNATKTDLNDIWYKQQDIALRKQALQQTDPLTGANNNIPPAIVNSDGSVNQQSQQAFLAGLPGGPTGDVATLIKGIANYTINPNVSPQKLYKGTSGLTQAQVVTLASQYDPTYSESLYATRQALVKDFTSGTYSQNINSLNTAITHVSSLLDTVKSLGNAGLTPLNAAVNATKSAFGSGAPSSAKLHISAVTDELAAALKKSGATDNDIKSLGVLNSNSSPDQFKEYIAAATSLLGARLSNLTDTYVAGMGKPPANGTFLNPTAATALMKMQASGIPVDVPELNNTPVGKVAAFGNANPSEQAKITQMESDGVSYQDILNYYNQQ